MTRLTVDDVSRSIGDVRILEGISFELAAGERLALVGPSGSGKSTLLRLIGGFDRVDAGRILRDNEVLSSIHEHVPTRRRRIGYVPQEDALFPHMTAAANIGFGVPRSRRIEATARAADIGGIERDLLSRYPHELSGGQQQRVALARALATEPGIVLLDEPFSALDTGLRASTRDAVLRMLDRVGVTTILVTHDQTEALQFGQSIGVLEAGRLAQHGTPDAVYDSPASLAVYRFLGPAVTLPAKIDGRDAITPLGSHMITNDRRSGSGPAVAAFRPSQFIVTSDGPPVARVVARVDDGARILLHLALHGAEVMAEVPRHAAAQIEDAQMAGLAVDGPVSVYSSPDVCPPRPSQSSTV